MFNSAEHYDRHVGRYNAELARALISFAGVRPGQRVLDVGCGPGALTRELVAVVGADHVAAVDPSHSFAEACRARLPGVDVRIASAEELPFANATFDHALAQLVVNFMAGAKDGVTEMRRVTRPGGRVSAATWDYASEMTFLRRFWDAAIATDAQAAAVDEAVTMRYCNPDELRDLLASTGLVDIAISSAVPHAAYANFDDLWEPITGGIGPSGVYVRSLDEQAQGVLKDAYRAILGVGDAPFELTARAWLACGVVPSA